MPGKRICVVGAGPSGLVATKTLAAAGLNAVCFEASSVIGGQWVIDNPGDRSAAYRSLHTNTTRRMSRFSDYDMPDHWPEFPDAAQVAGWFGDYAEHFGLHPRIRLSTEVLRAAPQENRGWTVTLRLPDGRMQEEAFDGMMIASGIYWQPLRPSWPGQFAGEILHAQAYRDPTVPLDLRGKHVVVVGTGNTGCEIAVEIARGGAASVTLSARSGAWILPKTVNGEPLTNMAPMTHPSDPLVPVFHLVPPRYRQALFAYVARQRMHKSFGAMQAELASLGLPPAPDHPLAKRATIAQDLLEAMRAGEVTGKRAIRALDGKEAVFEDGTRAPADVVICATGYHLTFPYLDAAIADTSGGDLKLFCCAMSPVRHDLFFAGLGRPTGAFWPIAEVQSRLAAAAFSGAWSPPRQEEIDRRSRGVMSGKAFNPAIYGREIDTELKRGAARV